MESDNKIIPDADESINLWSAIWGQNVQYNEKAEWVKDIEEDVAYVER